MKLWNSFTKELLLSSKSFYFWIEIIMAFIIMFVLMFVVPENPVSRQTEYLYVEEELLEFENPMTGESFLDVLLDGDEDGILEETTIKSGGDEYDVRLIVTEDQEIYLMESLEDLDYLADVKSPMAAAHIYLEEGAMKYDYYIQGYESERLQNLYKVIHAVSTEEVQAAFDSIEVETLGEEVEPLNNRQNMVPPLIVMNGAMLGMFIIASYIFLDRQEGIIKAYAVTSAKPRYYLLSKVFVLMLVSVVSTLLITIPVLGTMPVYWAILLLLITSAFFASSIGLIISTYYDSMTQAFGAIYALMIALLVPSIAYFIPSWEPTWVKFMPTYALIQGFKESIIPNGDMNYVLLASLGYVVVGAILFAFAEYRFKRNLGA
jgi:hypothetical protein